MKIWERKEWKVGTDTTLTLMNTGHRVEVEIEDNQYTHDLTWMYLDEDAVDDVIAFLQDWKKNRETK